MQPCPWPRDKTSCQSQKSPFFVVENFLTRLCQISWFYLDRVNPAVIFQSWLSRFFFFFFFLSAKLDVHHAKEPEITRGVQSRPFWLDEQQNQASIAHRYTPNLFSCLYFFFSFLLLFLEWQRVILLRVHAVGAFSAWVVSWGCVVGTSWRN